MAKAASPIRLQEELMKAAELTAGRFHRSTAEQIEYWAALGRSISTVIDPDVLLSVQSGLAKIKIEPINSAPVNPDDIFNVLESEREKGTLANRVTTAVVRYQASSEYPGYLDRIDPQGNLTTGMFQDGQFVVKQ